MHRHRSIWALCFAGAFLAGCGGGVTVQVGGGEGQTGRAVPLIGYYNGGLLNFGTRNAFEFYLQRDGAATGVIRLLETGQRIELVGQVSGDRILRLSNSEMYLDGVFGGAYNPNSPSQYIREGVLFYGTWALLSGGSGRVEAAHETWPPPPSYSGGTSIDNDYDGPWYDPDDDDDTYDPYPGGGTSGGTDDPFDGGFDPGTPDTGSPPGTGGEPTNDDIIFRRPVELDGD